MALIAFEGAGNGALTVKQQAPSSKHLESRRSWRSVKTSLCGVILPVVALATGSSCVVPQASELLTHIAHLLKHGLMGGSPTHKGLMIILNPGHTDTPVKRQLP